MTLAKWYIQVLQQEPWGLALHRPERSPRGGAPIGGTERGSTAVGEASPGEQASRRHPHEEAVGTADVPRMPVRVLQEHAGAR
jgi:hypothetical protein